MRKYTDSQLSQFSLDYAERLYRAGCLSQDDLERHYHLWRSNPHLLCDYPPCQCLECQEQRARCLAVRSGRRRLKGVKIA